MAKKKKEAIQDILDRINDDIETIRDKVQEMEDSADNIRSDDESDED